MGTDKNTKDTPNLIELQSSILKICNSLQAIIDSEEDRPSSNIKISDIEVRIEKSSLEEFSLYRRGGETDSCKSLYVPNAFKFGDVKFVFGDGEGTYRKAILSLKKGKGKQ